MLDPRGSHKRERVQPSSCPDPQSNPGQSKKSPRGRGGAGAAAQSERRPAEPGRARATPRKAGQRARPRRRAHHPARIAQNVWFCVMSRSDCTKPRVLRKSPHWRGECGRASDRQRCTPRAPSPLHQDQSGGAGAGSGASADEGGNEAPRPSSAPRSHWLCWRRRSPRTAAKPAARRRCCRRAPRYGSSCCRRSRTAFRLPSSVSCPGSASRS